MFPCINDKIFLNSFCEHNIPTTEQIDVGIYASTHSLAAIATNTNTTAKAVHTSIVAKLGSELFSDFRALLVGGRYVTNWVATTSYNTSSATSGTITTSGQTGVCLQVRQSYPAPSIKKLKITEVSLNFAQAYSNVTLYIASGGLVMPYLLPSVTAGVNIFTLPTPYTSNNALVKVYIVGNYLMNRATTLMPSCGSCAANGYPCASFSPIFNGSTMNGGKEMYGISVQHSCGCDYDGLFCEVVNSGAFDTLILLRYQEIYWHQLKMSSRINSAATFTDEVIQYNINDLRDRISLEFDTLQKGFSNYIKQYSDNICVICNSIGYKKLV